MLEKIRPKVAVLSKEMIERVIDEACEILERVGVSVINAEARRLLGEGGCRIGDRVRIPRKLIEECVEMTPSAIRVFDRDGGEALDLEADNVYFDPGSSVLQFLDYEKMEVRKPLTRDYVDFTRVTAQMEYIKAQSTAMVCADVSEEILDSYRLYLSLVYCHKPVVTGIFRKASLPFMFELLETVRGGGRSLREKPLAIFDACPSPPLKWEDLTAQSLIDCARRGIPSELVSMPLAGATAPVTLLGAVVQHAAESLSGIVIGQIAAPGAPLIWGGSPTIFDMRAGTTPIGAVETMMIDTAYAQVGKHLGLPTHAYMGASDAKLIDFQGGFESGMGILMAGLAGINVVSGAGMLNFENCQSMEKLVLDNELCGMAYRLIDGVCQRDEPIALGLFERLENLRDGFLANDHTLKWYRAEQQAPGPVVDRSSG
ncbi:MAG: trimethylamine methyltransferase family protein, partial [Deltaproteobacteria bacterium]|nr:trimethylamine methyltransferase family protein [Deltaproteobacteria bacterium]